MLLRNHPELSPWPDLNGISAVPPLPTAREAVALRIQNIRIATPARIHIVLNYGAGTCLWTKDFNDGVFATAVYDNRNKLIGKTLQQAGDVDIIP